MKNKKIDGLYLAGFFVGILVGYILVSEFLYFITKGQLNIKL